MAMALEQHVKHYDVDIMNLQRAEKLIPGEDLIEVQLAGGASLKAKTVILSTGARWRQMNVPARTSTATRAWPTARTATARCSRASAPLSSAAATPAWKQPSTWRASSSTLS